MRGTNHVLLSLSMLVAAACHKKSSDAALEETDSAVVQDSGRTADDPALALAGSWETACIASGATSQMLTMTIADASYSEKQRSYSDTNCSDLASTLTSRGTIAIGPPDPGVQPADGHGAPSDAVSLQVDLAAAPYEQVDATPAAAAQSNASKRWCFDQWQAGEPQLIATNCAAQPAALTTIYTSFTLSGDELLVAAGSADQGKSPDHRRLIYDHTDVSSVYRSVPAP